jgi:hypothetical protein
MKQVADLKKLTIRTFLGLILLTTDACGMTKEKSELSWRFSDDLGQSYATQLLKEIYPNGSDAKQLVKDLEDIKFKCKIEESKTTCVRSPFLGIHWYINIMTDQEFRIKEISIQRHSSLP